jgi:hypothetical protein
LLFFANIEIGNKFGLSPDCLPPEGKSLITQPPSPHPKTGISQFPDKRAPYSLGNFAIKVIHRIGKNGEGWHFSQTSATY